MLIKEHIPLSSADLLRNPASPAATHVPHWPRPTSRRSRSRPALFPRCKSCISRRLSVCPRRVGKRPNKLYIRTPPASFQTSLSKNNLPHRAARGALGCICILCDCFFSVSWISCFLFCAAASLSWTAELPFAKSVAVIGSPPSIPILDPCRL